MNWTEKQLAHFLYRDGCVGSPNIANTSNPPFLLPAEVTLDLPVPISVNKLRRINWRKHRHAGLWRDRADRYLLAAKTRPFNPVKLAGIERFEVHILLSETKVFLDADNSCKLLIDYLRHRNIIKDDGPQHMRRLTVEWGDAPTGCRVTIRPLPSAQEFKAGEG